MVVARQAAIEKLEAKAAEAGKKHAEPFWSHGMHTPQRWAQQAYQAAIGVMRNSALRPGDTVESYLARMRDEVAGYRGNGPDLDDESWYDSAIDDACMTITSR